MKPIFNRQLILGWPVNKVKPMNCYTLTPQTNKREAIGRISLLSNVGTALGLSF